MEVENILNITSEIGQLKTVLVKRPGSELENITPEYLQSLLFDDIPYLKMMQKEHDYFVKTMQDSQIEVLYLEKLAAEALRESGNKEAFLTKMIRESNQMDASALYVRDYLMSFDEDEMINKLMSGLKKSEIPEQKKKHLNEMMEKQYPFFLDPLPNLYFTRDPAAVIGNGVTINKMFQPARRRESMFMELILQHHPRFNKQEIPIWINREAQFSMEGGDELILNEETILIGVSERTDARAVEQLAENLFSRGAEIKRVLAVEIPETRSFMHLDTVFTMVNFDQFTIHPAIQNKQGELNVYILEKSDNNLEITLRKDFQHVIAEVLQVPEVDFIPCGGEDVIVSAREQWNDGANTLAIAPGEVVTYDRNQVSNDLLRSAGINVHEVISSELSRGRGGPRCMTMPLVRENL
ncbi:arginine deiminase [Listeria ivanovii]|uniref:arginine deiminase n=1 Tax=Listeria ivanovii TaxID=1638 RepID=UPI00098D069E|nr:arginine deiminase [Listeria ivanovii]MBK1983819.1 arginine deiminase [Listeria ivanovii subsp. londoniensis]MBK1995895.1 arginine deiminase [Listeria ivanovii subsp. londoniensis]MBK2003260.1 arginine deiminase [Listeria ivanovii subsp. londoniensis]MBM5608736.1 arginine deiminase [Listeria ivanovii]MBM5636896.1 arginine deiminase [Listeria ivanovii]